MCTQDINYYKACEHGIWQRSIRNHCNRPRAPGSKHCDRKWAHDVEWWPGECANCRKLRTAGNQIERSSGRLIRWMEEGSNPTSQGLEQQKLHREMATEYEVQRKAEGNPRFVSIPIGVIAINSLCHSAYQLVFFCRYLRNLRNTPQELSRNAVALQPKQHSFVSKFVEFDLFLLLFSSSSSSRPLFFSFPFTFYSFTATDRDTFSPFVTVSAGSVSRRAGNF